MPHGDRGLEAQACLLQRLGTVETVLTAALGSVSGLLGQTPGNLPSSLGSLPPCFSTPSSTEFHCGVMSVLIPITLRVSALDVHSHLYREPEKANLLIGTGTAHISRLNSDLPFAKRLPSLGGGGGGGRKSRIPSHQLGWAERSLPPPRWIQSWTRLR